MKCRLNCLFVWLLCLSFPVAAGYGAPIRLTSWDLQPATAQSSPNLIQTAAYALKKLNSDVILLQDIENAKACQELARDLAPQKYEVIVCSAFPSLQTNGLGGQVAILAKAKSFLSWPEQWQRSDESGAARGGFAFAAIPFGNVNLGVFSVKLDNPSASADDTALQLVKAIDSLQNLRAKPIQSIIVAGNLTTAPRLLPLVHERTLLHLGQIGFGSVFASSPSPKRMGDLDYVFTRGAGLAAGAATTGNALFLHDAITFDVEIAPANRIGPVAAIIGVKPGLHRSRIIYWVVGFLPLGLGFWWFARKPPASVAATKAVVVRSEQPPYIHIDTKGATQTQSQTWRHEALREGVIAQLSKWLKQAMLQRLISDRAQLLATQQAATVKVLAMDERLAKVEEHLRQRNHEYEQRIDDLLRALDDAREENRELIQAKIALLKAEMERERLRVGERGDEYHQY